MDEQEKGRRRRWRNACARLGTPMPACSHCGEPNPHCLERHEPGGRRYNDVSVILCRTCHRKQSDAQYDHPRPIWKSPEPHEQIAHTLLGLADFFEVLVLQFRKYAETLLELSRKEAVPPDEGDA